MKKTKNNPSFQEAFDELEQIAEKFESGTLDLEKSLALYERGLMLVGICKKRVSLVENRVKEINAKFSPSFFSEEMEDA